MNNTALVQSVSGKQLAIIEEILPWIFTPIYNVSSVFTPCGIMNQDHYKSHVARK
jgi:hypothetical protein